MAAPKGAGAPERERQGTLYCGDNLEVLRERYIQPESVDLIYLDPPFNSQRTYNLIYKGSRAQEVAFKDYWAWEEAASTYARAVNHAALPLRLRTLLKTLHDMMVESNSDLLAYLVMMSVRLVELYRTLKPTGSLYLHCDPTASHYLKVMLDTIFGHDNFRNEITWQRAGAKNDPRRYGRSHDIIFFYTKSSSFTWNQQYTPFQDYSVAKNYTAVEEGTGRRYRLSDLTANKPGGDTDYEWHGVRPYKGRHWAFSREKMDAMLAAGRIVFRRTGMPVYKRYLDEMPGVPLHDVWIDIKLASAAAERTGYGTQKPLALLERIIKSSSNEGDLVLDPFCGCGTTIEAAEHLGRRWVGIDISQKAVEIVEKRFADANLPAPSVVWCPPDLDAARALAERDPHQFERWVLRRIGARRMRKTDRGIDGEAFFQEQNGTTWHVLVSVKGGRTLNPSMVRDLAWTMNRENAAIGALVSLQEPTDGMRREATHAGFLDVSDMNGPIPRVQFLTVSELFRGGRIRVRGDNKTKPQSIVPPAPAEKTQLALPIPYAMLPSPELAKAAENTEARPGPASARTRRGKSLGVGIERSDATPAKKARRGSGKRKVGVRKRRPEDRV